MSTPKTEIEYAPVVMADDFAEEQLIAALLLDGTQVNAAVLQHLAPEHFWHTHFGWAYDAMLTVRATGETSDYTGVIDELTRRGQYDEFGGWAEMNRLLSLYFSASLASVRNLARVVRQYAERRALLKWCSDVATRVYNDLEAEPVAVWSEAMDALTHQRPHTGNNDLLLGRDSIAYYDRLIDEACANPVWYPTPWKALESCAPVYKPGDILVIAGPEGSGKSAMALNWAQFYAEKMGHRVLYIHTEMDKENVLARRKVANSKLSYSKLLTPDEMTDQEIAEFHRADEGISKWADNLDTWEAGAIQAREMLSHIKLHVDRFGLQVVVIDGLNDLDYTVPKSSTLSQTIRTFMSHLETFARANNLLVLATAQLNREGEEYGSSAYKQKAALLLRIEVETAQSPQSMSFQGITYGCEAGENGLFRKVLVSKNRRGKSGQKVNLAFLGARFLWVDVPAGHNITDAMNIANSAPAPLMLGGE